jgi:hypothetical protein
MTGKISLVLGSHAHIFPSAADEEFEELYRTTLMPFITVLNQFPKIPAVLHYSGSLFSRLEQKKPECFLLIKDMAARKQLELLGGGFYEPLLPLLPPADKIGQIEMLTTYLRQHFGRKPQGCMPAHSGWEQSLVGVLAACGMAYTFLSEEQFDAAGCKGKSLLTPVYTEDQGKLLVVFPVFSSLARMGTEGVLPVLQGFFSGDEAQKPASGPAGSPASCLITVFPVFPRENAEEGIRSFFTDLSAILADKTREFSLELSTPGKMYRACASLPRVYFFPSGDPSCPQPRSCLTRYPEANEIYARVYFVHNLINQFRGDKSRKRSAREELWKAEGAETIMHTGSGELRRYAHKTILASERIIRENDFKPSLLNFDFNLNRIDEYLFQDKNINCYVRTRGASVFELDYLPKGWNYLDAFSGGFDRRCAFTDMFFPGDFVPSADPGSALCSFPGAEPFPENSRFCGTEEYKLLSADRTKLRAAFVLSPRKGIPFGFIEIQKTYRLEKNVLYLSYGLYNRGDEKTILCFIPRFDLALAGEQLFFRRSQGEEESSAEKKGERRRVLTVEERDTRHGASLSVGFQTPCDLYYSELEALGTCCFLPVFQLFLNPGDVWENQITLAVSAKARKG